MSSFSELWNIFVRNLDHNGNKFQARSALKILRIANKFNRHVLLGNTDNFMTILKNFTKEKCID